MYHEMKQYSLNDVKQRLNGYGDCEAAYLFMSNRQEGCKTVRDFYDARFFRESAPMSKKFSFGVGQRPSFLDDFVAQSAIKEDTK